MLQRAQANAHAAPWLYLLGVRGRLPSAAEEGPAVQANRGGGDGDLEQHCQRKDGENIRALVNKFMRDAACLPLLWVKAGGDNTTMDNMPPFLGADNADLKKHLLMSLFRALPAHFLKASGAEAPGAAFTNLVSADGASCAALTNPR